LLSGLESKEIYKKFMKKGASIGDVDVTKKNTKIQNNNIVS